MYVFWLVGYYLKLLVVLILVDEKDFESLYYYYDSYLCLSIKWIDLRYNCVRYQDNGFGC
ncbi:hypothetical protein CMI38_04105 [Candidatus Pacearchaeota archaeon]|nr:hypothetical protein [Candidatus Pacearchaeota archaeon]